MRDCLRRLRVFLCSKFPECSQSKDQPKADFEGHIVLNGTPDVDSLDVPLYPLNRNNIVASSRRILRRKVVSKLSSPRDSVHETGRCSKRQVKQHLHAKGGLVPSSRQSFRNRASAG